MTLFTMGLVALLTGVAVVVLEARRLRILERRTEATYVLPAVDAEVNPLVAPVEVGPTEEAALATAEAIPEHMIVPRPAPSGELGDSVAHGNAPERSVSRSRRRGASRLDEGRALVDVEDALRLHRIKRERLSARQDEVAEAAKLSERTLLAAFDEHGVQSVEGLPRTALLKVLEREQALEDLKREVQILALNVERQGEVLAELRQVLSRSGRGRRRPLFQA